MAPENTHRGRLRGVSQNRGDALTQKGKCMSASQLVVDVGGWNDPAAIQGSTTLMKRCLRMDNPWFIHDPPADWQVVVFEVDVLVP